MSHVMQVSVLYVIPIIGRYLTKKYSLSHRCSLCSTCARSTNN